MLGAHAWALAKSVGTPPPTVIVLVEPLQDDALSFQQVIGDAAQLALQKRGLASQIDSLSPKEDAQPLPRATAAGASVALLCSYEVEGRQMTVRLGWYDTTAAASAATPSAMARGDIDLHLDAVILSAFDEILGKVQDRVQVLEVGQEIRTPAGTGAGLQPAHSPQDTPISGTTGRRQSWAQFVLSGGFAPFIPAGAASSYFGLGYMPSLLVGVLLPTSAGTIGIGVYTGLDYFEAVGLVDSSLNYLVPIGIDFRYELNFGRLHPFVHFAGGPALLFMVTGVQGTFQDILPFLKSGLGLDVAITPWLAVTTVVDYDVYFEMPYLLMGFSPSLNMEVTL